MEENKKETKPVKKTEDKKVETTQAKTENKGETAKAQVKKEEKKETKTTNKKVEEKKTNNNTIMIGVVVAVVVAIAIIVSSMLLGKDTPKAVVEKELKNLKTGDFTQEVLSGLLLEENIDTEMMKLLYEKLEWKILEEKEEGETATIEVEITNKDFKVIMEKLEQKLFRTAITGNITQETLNNLLLEELRSEEIETTTENAIISLKKEEGKWEIAEKEKFYNATMPGLEEAIEAIQ